MPDELTRLLVGVSQGNRDDREALMPMVYDELRAMAGQRMRSEREGHTLQPTALVNEVYLRLIDQSEVDWRDRSHFFAVAAKLMRQILIDHARKRLANKRGGGAARVPIDNQLEISESTDPAQLVALDDLLTELEQLNKRHAKVIEMRVFGGMNINETAEALKVSPATIKNDYRAARAWLMTQCRSEEPPEDSP